MSRESRRYKKVHATCGHRNVWSYNNPNPPYFMEWYCPDCHHFALWDEELDEFVWTWVRTNLPVKRPKLVPAAKLRIKRPSSKL